MKKSKKLGLQSLALVLMSLVLVAGVAFGMTGAWFQDADSATSNTITMGNPVLINLKQGSTAVEETFTLTRERTDASDNTAMPGDTYTVKGGLVVANEGSTSAMYVFAKMTLETYDTATSSWITYTVADGEEGTFNTENLALADSTVTTINETALTCTWNVYSLDAGENKSVTILAEDASIELAESLTNAVANEQLRVKVEVKAIQQANIEAADLTDTFIGNIAAYSAN